MAAHSRRYETLFLFVNGVCANGFVGIIADAASQPIVDGIMRNGAEGLIVISGHIECVAQLFVEFAKVSEFADERGKLLALASDEKFLVAGVPELRELAIFHDGGKFGHLIAAIRRFAEFGAAVVFFDARDSAGATHGECGLREVGFNFLGAELCIDVPHGNKQLKESRAERQEHVHRMKLQMASAASAMRMT